MSKMTPEEIKAAETAKAEAEAKAQADKEQADADFEASIADLSDEEKEAKRAEKEADSSSSQIDYDAELKKEREAREKAEKSAAEKDFKLRELKRKQGDDKGDLDDDKPLTGKELQAILAEERLQTQKTVQSARAEELAKKYTTNDTELKLILEIHKNRTFPQHLSLEDQIEESYVIANRKKIIGENSELKRALRGKGGVDNNPASTHRDAPVVGEPQLSSADKQALTAVGFVYNGTNRRYEKKLSNGNILVRDSKTRQTYMVKAK